MAAAEKIIAALGTVNSVRVLADTREEALAAVNAAEKLILSCNARFSRFADTGDIHEINSRPGEPVRVSPETLGIVRLSLEYRQLTGGAFDITFPFGGRVDADTQNGCVTAFGAGLDLGGIAKGWLADRIRELITGMGVKSAVINLGGTVCVIGGPAAVGIRNPFSPRAQEPAAELTLENAVCATSGQYERAGHIKDPSTGLPADSGIMSVTLAGKDGALLDALATACVVKGLAGSLEMLKGTGAEGVFIMKDGRIIATEGTRNILIIRGSK